MLHWLQPNTPRRISFFIELIIVSVLLHAILFFGLFFCYLSSGPEHHITLGAPCAHLANVVVMPFIVPIEQSVQSESKPRVTTAHKALPEKSGPKKRAPTTSIKKMPATKKIAPKKHLVSQEKKVQQSIKREEPKVIESKKIEQVKISEKALPKEIQKEQSAVVSQIEFDAIELQQLLQEELEVHWQPPAGLASDLSCEIKVSLTYQGAVKQLDLVSPSGVLVYDIHAQSTLMELHYPKQTWGKQLTVTFKQT